MTADERANRMIALTREAKAAHEEHTNLLTQELIENCAAMTAGQFGHLALEMCCRWLDAGVAHSAAGERRTSATLTSRNASQFGRTILVWAARTSDDLPGHGTCGEVAAIRAEPNQTDDGWAVICCAEPFDRRAWEQAGQQDRRVILVGGSQLAELMMTYGIGAVEHTVLRFGQLDRNHEAIMQLDDAGGDAATPC